MRVLFVLLFLATSAWAGIEDSWNQLAENRFDEARVSFEALRSEDDLAEIGWFLTHTGDGPTEDLQEAALDVLRRDPTSGASEFVLKWMDPFKECLADWAGLVGEVLENHHPENPELRVFYASNLRMRTRQFQERPPFERIARDAGFVTRWLVSPRYGAYPLPAFDKDWPPEQADWSGAVAYRSRTGVILPPRAAQGKGVFYATATIENPVAQAVTMRLFTYQNISVFVDGKLWGTMPNLESLHPRVGYLTGDLPAGKHQVVVKTTQNSSNNGQFSLLLSAKKQLSVSEPQVPTVALDESQVTGRFTEAGLLADLHDRKGELADLVRAYLQLNRKNDQAALQLLEPLARKHPKSKLVAGTISRIYINTVPYLPQDEQLGRGYQYLSALAMESPEHNLENLLTLALLLTKAQQKKSALELMNGVVEANPLFCDALEARLLFARQDGLADVQNKTLELLDDMGEDHRWAQARLLDVARREGDLERTRQLLENLGRLLPWEGYIAQLNEMDENYTAAIADLVKRYEVFDDRDFYPYAIARSYARLGNHAAQREWLNRTLEVNPGKREAILDLVNLDCFEGKDEDARARLREYLKLEPADAFFRQRLSHLEGRTAFEAFRVDPNEVIKAAKNKPISEGADSELLLDQLMVRLFPDGSQMRYTHLVTRVLTKKGVDEESELRLSDNLEILELRTIKADGSVYYPADIEHKSTISLSGIGVGDFIDEEHIEYLGPAYYDEDGLNAEMTFIFQGVDRIYHHSELVLIYPEKLEPEPVLISRNMPVEPEIMTRDGLKIVRWLTEEMPPLETEPAMPPATFLQPTASFYYNTSWEEIRDFYGHAVRVRMGLSDRVLAQVESWRAEDLPPLELARKVYEEVADRTEQGGNFFQDVNLVWETRKGNATLLLAAIFKALGFETDIVFAQQHEMRHYMLDSPQPVYSYAVLRLEIDGKTHWVDPNRKGLAFDYIPYVYRGSRGMVLDPKKALYAELPQGSDETERTVSNYNLYFRENGSAAGMGSDSFFGSMASQLNESYEALNKPEIKQRVEAALNQDFPGAELSDVVVGEDAPRGTFKMNTEFSHRNLAQIEGDTLSLPLPLNKVPMLETYATLPSRETPVRISQPHYDESSLTLMVPEGWQWQVKPVKVQEKSEFGSYELSLSLNEDRELTIKRVFHVKAQFVNPDRYADFQVFCRAMTEHEGLSLTAVKGEGQP